MEKEELDLEEAGEEAELEGRAMVLALEDGLSVGLGGGPERLLELVGVALVSEGGSDLIGNTLTKGNEGNEKDNDEDEDEDLEG